MQIKSAAFVTKVIPTKKKTSKIESTKLETNDTTNDGENERNRIQFKPATGASPVAVGPPQTKVSS